MSDQSHRLTIIRSKPELAAIWLSALIDGEGCVHIGQLKSGPHAGEVRRSVQIGMCDREVIDFASACLTALGVRHNVRHIAGRPPRRDVWNLSVGGGIGLRRLAETLTLVHAGKAERLASIAASYKPPTCGACGVALDQRTPGCEACQGRMKYRRKHGLPNVAGRTGRPPKAARAA